MNPEAPRPHFNFIPDQLTVAWVSVTATLNWPETTGGTLPVEARAPASPEARVLAALVPLSISAHLLGVETELSATISNSRWLTFSVVPAGMLMPLPPLRSLTTISIEVVPVGTWVAAAVLIRAGAPLGVAVARSYWARTVVPAPLKTISSDRL